MKKTTTLLLTLLSLPVFANNGTQQATAPISIDSSPMLKLAVYDLSNNVRREVEGRKYSIKNKHHQLCWVAFNMPLQFKNQVTEIFIAPSKSSFSAPSASVTTANNGKKHTIKENLSSVDNEYISRCWSFNHKDPKGKYTLQVKINDIYFEPQLFEIVK